MRELAWSGQISDELALDLLAQLDRAPIALAQAGSLDSAAYRLAARLGWKRTYDAEYLALAEARGCGLVTTDARLARVAEQTVGLVPLDAV
jgi:predicted nucleic acid-binding protein